MEESRQAGIEAHAQGDHPPATSEDSRKVERDSMQASESSFDSAKNTSAAAAPSQTSIITPASSTQNLEMPKTISRRPVGAASVQPQPLQTTQTTSEAGSRGHTRTPSLNSQVYTAPETTIIELISTSATASAFPESFGLTISQKGLWVAAYTSTALYIIRSEKLPATSGRFFKLRRKPLGMAICDDPQVLAILSNSHNVDVYTSQLEDGESGVWSNLKQRSVIFGHEISTVALSPDGKILAAGYRGGVEIVSVAPDAPENHRRQLSCEPMAEVVFSEDGRSLLATSVSRKTRPSTVVSVGNGMDGPMSDDGIMESLPPGQAWISQLLFPERTPHARQAAMIPDPTTGQVNDLFAFDSDKDTWGVYDLTMKRFTDYKVDVLNLMPSTQRMEYETALPAVASDFSQIALAVKHDNRSELLVYQVPYSWRADSPVSASPNSQKPELLRPLHGITLLKEGGAASESITKLRWTGKPGGPKRLLALASTSIRPVEETPAEMAPAAAGRIVLVDFAASSGPRSGPQKVTINFDALPEEVLGEQHMDFEREVSLLRARSQVVRRRGSGNSNRMRRSSTTYGLSRTNGLLSPSDVSEASLNRRHSVSSMTSDETDQSFGALVLDEPYAQSQPRSQFSLQRAATISAQSGASRRHLLALPDRPLEYRRADGLRFVPHESDADNWVPPPPPYTRNVEPNVHQSISNHQVSPIASPSPQSHNQGAEQPSGNRRRSRPAPLSNIPTSPPINPSPSAYHQNHNNMAASSPGIRAPPRTQNIPSAPPSPLPPLPQSPRRLDTDIHAPPSPLVRPSPEEPSPAQVAYMHHHNTFPVTSTGSAGTPVAVTPLTQSNSRLSALFAAPSPAFALHDQPRRVTSAELLKTLPPLPHEARKLKRRFGRGGAAGGASQSVNDLSLMTQRYYDDGVDGGGMHVGGTEVGRRKKGTKCVVM